MDNNEIKQIVERVMQAIEKKGLLNQPQKEETPFAGKGSLCSSKGGCSVEHMMCCIDHTVLKPTATNDEIIKLCREAKEYNFAAVCINPYFVHLAWKELKNASPKVCTVVGFPLGATTTEAKVFEARDAIGYGAEEIDMVINVGALKHKNYKRVLKDIQALREACKDEVLKVIIETAYLDREEKIKACLLAKEAGADFVKTSTGFGPGGATVEDVALMRETVGRDMGVKASGGVRDRATAEAMIKAGANRIGTSAGVQIISDMRKG
jgi:deoxyribose-phosphate aldolase